MPSLFLVITLFHASTSMDGLLRKSRGSQRLWQRPTDLGWHPTLLRRAGQLEAG